MHLNDTLLGFFVSVFVYFVLLRVLFVVRYFTECVKFSDSHTHTHTHTHSQTTGGLLRSGDYQANGGHHGEEKMFVAVLSLHPKTLGRQVRNV